MKNNANENEMLMQGSKWQHPNSHNKITSSNILDWEGKVKWCALNHHIYDAMTRTLQHFKGQNQEATFWKIKSMVMFMMQIIKDIMKLIWVLGNSCSHY
jgi:hypothetical protein